VVKRVFLILLLLLAVWLLWEWATFPNTAKLATENPATTAFMEARKQELRAAGKSDALLYTFVRYDRISPYLRRGVLVAEDNDFYEHQGVDVKAMKDAVERDWQRRKITHGGSTITQQLAKNLYLSPSRNPLRKVKEYFLARSLERHLSKKRILELYLNVVEMGERVYGAEAASQFYFNEHASALTLQQAALLAGCLPNPRVMNPAHPNSRLRARENMIVSRMRRWGYVYEREVLSAPKPAEAPAPPPAVETQQTQTTQTAAPATDTDLAPPDETTSTTVTTPPQGTTESPSTETTPTGTLPPTGTTATH